MNNLFLWLIFLKAGEESNFIIIISNNHISHKINDCKRQLSGEEYFFEIAEAVFVGWFSFEYVVRFIAAPHKSKWEQRVLFFLKIWPWQELSQKIIFKSIRFVKGAMNIVDLLGILPYFMSLVLQLVTNEKDSVVSLHSFRRHHCSYLYISTFYMFSLSCCICICIFQTITRCVQSGVGRSEAKYESQMRRIAQIFRIMRILRWETEIP